MGNVCESEGNKSSSIINQANNRQENSKIDQALTEHKGIKIKTMKKLSPSICKIIFGSKLGTGFFMKVPFYKSSIFLITCFHVLSNDSINEYVDIEIHNENRYKIKIDSKERFIRYINKSKDITIIEIKYTDEFIKYIDFLNCDINFLDNINKYEEYREQYVFCFQYPKGSELEVAVGKIININNYEFDHNINTEPGSSGAPIILLSNSKVIGIHKSGDSEKNINTGTFIGEIFNLINNKTIPKIINNDNINKKINSIDNTNKNKNNNEDYILAEIEVEKIGYQRILNSAEKILKIFIDLNYDINREIDWMEEKLEKLKNEPKIELRLEINDNDETITFKYPYRRPYLSYDFKKKGKNKIKYIFKKLATNTCFMFHQCFENSSIINLDFSNFQTQNLTDTSGMLNTIKGVKTINLYNFNTQNVTDMSRMFGNCESLINLEWPNVDTRNVVDMRDMFRGCRALKNLDLSNFDTKNVVCMEDMFRQCCSLEKLNISNFNTRNVETMYSMFSSCFKLKDLDLSNFNTKNVWNMNNMFRECSSIINLDLSNFTAENVEATKNMFEDCHSLKILNLENFNPKTINQMFWGCKSLEKLISNNDLIIKKYNEIKDYYKEKEKDKEKEGCSIY